MEINMTLSVRLGIKSLSLQLVHILKLKYFTYRGLRTNCSIFDLHHKIISYLFTGRTYIRIISNMAEITTSRLPNTSQKNYGCCLCHDKCMSI